MAGSLILASVVLKLSLYGIVRLILPILPKAYLDNTYFIYIIGVITIIYASIATLRTTDIKELIAYSSVSHASVYLLGIFSNNIQGIQGAIVFGLAHGFVSSGLFICVGGILYDRSGNRLITLYKGLAQLMPIFSILFFILCLANAGAPLTFNFIGEFMSLYGAFERLPLLGIIASTSIILSAAYSMFMLNRLIFTGSFSKLFLFNISDLNKRELSLLLFLTLLTVVFGIYPAPLFDSLNYFVTNVLYNCDYSPYSYFFFKLIPGFYTRKNNKYFSSNFFNYNHPKEKKNKYLHLALCKFFTLKNFTILIVATFFSLFIRNVFSLYELKYGILQSDLLFTLSSFTCASTGSFIRILFECWDPEGIKWSFYRLIKLIGWEKNLETYSPFLNDYFKDKITIGGYNVENKDIFDINRCHIHSMDFSLPPNQQATQQATQQAEGSGQQQNVSQPPVSQPSSYTVYTPNPSFEGYPTISFPYTQNGERYNPFFVPRLNIRGKSGSIPFSYLSPETPTHLPIPSSERKREIKAFLDDFKKATLKDNTHSHYPSFNRKPITMTHLFCRIEDAYDQRVSLGLGTELKKAILSDPELRAKYR